LRAARGEFIARMDAHTVYPPRYLESGVQRLRRGDVDSVSGPQLAVGVDPGSRRVALALRTALGTGGARFRREMEGEVEVDTGFTGLWRRSTLTAQRGWDEEWINDQDVELAARLRKEGGRIVCIPEMAAEYIPRASLRALARQYLTYGRFRVKTARRHPESLRRSQILPPALLITCFAAVAAPRPLRGVARMGAGAYAVTLLVTSVRAARRGGAADAAVLPLIWATMHLSYGAGFMLGCAREGPPLAAIAGLLGARSES
jgi:succinoglycan biosynthesis protein ExoA